MRITELMLKDWVEIFDPEYDEGEGKNSKAQISRLKITDMGEPLVGFDEWNSNYDARTWIRGIKLTHEILELNGFVRNDESVWYEYTNGIKWINVEYCTKDNTNDPDPDSFVFDDCECKYVHQLQNFMRMRGFTSEANKFIIEEKENYDEDI